jgi:hypothetical protein
MAAVEPRRSLTQRNEAGLRANIRRVEPLGQGSPFRRPSLGGRDLHAHVADPVFGYWVRAAVLESSSARSPLRSTAHASVPRTLRLSGISVSGLGVRQETDYAIGLSFLNFPRSCIHLLMRL